MLRPPDLRPGDTIAIISPAGIARQPATQQAVELLRQRGWNATIMPNALGSFGSFSGSVHQRAADLHNALSDPDIKAILCSRGGYGAVHLLDKISLRVVASNPKWLIGFSDISVLHALWLHAGVQSIHGPMVKHILSSASPLSANSADLPQLESILLGQSPTYRWASHPLNHPGQATGTLVGGNFSVISALAGTPFDPLAVPEAIIFIEDINEPVYKIERLIYRLRLLHSSRPDHIRGIVAGDFTGVAPDINQASMYDMLHAATMQMHIPLALGFPAGHNASASPLILGATVSLVVADEATLRFSDPSIS